MTEEQQIEVTIEQAEKAISLRDDLYKLENSPTFKRLIKRGFFDDFVKENVASMNMAALNEMHETKVRNSLMGVSVLQQYFRGIIAAGNQAEQTRKEHMKLQAEIEAGQE